jgi:predicted nucleic acid-binding protein
VEEVRPVFDTNILIDYLNGHMQAVEEFARYPAATISPITWIEVMVGAKSESEENTLRSFLGRFKQIPLDRQVAEAAAMIRKQHRIRLPDAIIWGSARSEGTLLVTRNTDDFPEHEPDVRVPYRL